jgi:hypothetical protein
MLVVDLMHEFELGIWKAIFAHLIRLLYAVVPGGRMVTELDRRFSNLLNLDTPLDNFLRFRQVPTFGRGTIRRFSENASEMKKMAARNYEDLLQVSRTLITLTITDLDHTIQCAIPTFEGLLPSPHNEIVLTVLFRLAEWHALAKLRMHTESTLTYMESVTTVIGRELRKFVNITCSSFSTVELPKETAARGRKCTREQAKGSTSAPTMPATGKSGKPKPKRKKLNLSTYKIHALPDYPRTIRMFGTTDSYSTQTVSTMPSTRERQNSVSVDRVSVNIVESSDSTDALTKILPSNKSHGTNDGRHESYGRSEPPATMLQDLTHTMSNSRKAMHCRTQIRLYITIFRTQGNMEKICFPSRSSSPMIQQPRS